MQNAPHDLRDYVLDELDEAQKAEMERFLANSAEAREEVDRLRLTHQTLRSLPDEEPPQRIAFVSDKVFEPSGWARFWRTVWSESPRAAFGAAALLAVFFAGAALTEPRISLDDGSFELAFGPQAEPAAEAAVEPAGLNEATIRDAVQEAVTEAVSRERDEMLRLVAERLEVSEAEWRETLAEHRQDIETGLTLINKRQELLEKNQMLMAGVQ